MPPLTKTICILLFDGTNRQHDLMDALNYVAQQPPIKNLGYNITIGFHSALQPLPPLNPKTDVVFLPGGFSYGDYLRSGAMAAKTPAMQQLKNFANQKGKVIGICNGFQILCEANLLQGVLTRNNAQPPKNQPLNFISSGFICRNQWLKSAEPQPNQPTSLALALKTTFHQQCSNGFSFPIAHGDGNFWLNADGLTNYQNQQQILFYYIDNPNGSRSDIAAVHNQWGNVIGLMPHPENATLPHQITNGNHGQWFFQTILGYQDE